MTHVQQAAVLTSIPNETPPPTPPHLGDSNTTEEVNLMSPIQ